MKLFSTHSIPFASASKLETLFYSLDIFCFIRLCFLFQVIITFATLGSGESTRRCKRRGGGELGSQNLFGHRGGDAARQKQKNIARSTKSEQSSFISRNRITRASQNRCYFSDLDASQSPIKQTDSQPTSRSSRQEMKAW